jgi:hypothetical protein
VPNGTRAPVLLGHSAAHANFVDEHSHAVAPAHFVRHGFCCAKPLFGLAKRCKQLERYAKCSSKLLGRIVVAELMPPQRKNILQNNNYYLTKFPIGLY